MQKPTLVNQGFVAAAAQFGSEFELRDEPQQPGRAEQIEPARSKKRQRQPAGFVPGVTLEIDEEIASATSKPKLTATGACVVVGLVKASEIEGVVLEGHEWISDVQAGKQPINDGVAASRRPGYSTQSEAWIATFRHLILSYPSPKLDQATARRLVLPLLLALNPDFRADLPRSGVPALWDPRVSDAEFNFVRHFKRHRDNRANLLGWAFSFAEPRFVPLGDSWRRLLALAKSVCDELGVPVRMPAPRDDEPELTLLQFHIVRLVSQSARSLSGVEIENLVNPDGASTWVRDRLADLHLRKRVLENGNGTYWLRTTPLP